ncbi:MAG: hypothetical protein ABSB82_08160 [Terriglobia bacterium]|jgi:hypothetical protein
MSFEQALDSLSRDERFKATIYAMNSLLIQKGVYTPQEFERLFAEWAAKQRANEEAAIGECLPATGS